MKQERYSRRYYEGDDSNYIFNYANLKYAIFWKRRLKILGSFVRSGKILDCGCAYGFLLKLVEKRFDIFGIDISAYAIEKAKERLPDTARLDCCDVEDGIPFDEKFDVITAFDIMEHINDPSRALKTFNGALKNEGHLYIELPIAPTPINRDIMHIYRPLETWCDFLRNAGFEITLIRSYYTIGFRMIMIPSRKFANYCSIVAKKIS